MDDEEFKRIYDTSYESRSPPKKEKLEEEKTEGKSEEESDGPDDDGVPGVPVSFQSRQSKLQDAKEKSKELKWKRKREDELLCKICGEYGHYSQGCPSTLKTRKASELRKRSLMEKIILSDFRLPSRIIGTGGAIVKGIEKDTNCRIQIETPKSPSDEPLHVRISGDDPAEVESAKQAVLKIIEEWTNQRGHEHRPSFMPRKDFLPQMEQPLTSRYDQWPGWPLSSYPSMTQQQPKSQQPLEAYSYSASGGGQSDRLQQEQQPQLESFLPSEVIAIQRRYSRMEADEIERHRTAMQKLREDQQKELEDIRGRAANKRAHQSHELLQSLLVSLQQRCGQSNNASGGGPTGAQWLSWAGSAVSYSPDGQRTATPHGLPRSAAEAQSHTSHQSTGTNGPLPVPELTKGALESFMAHLSTYVGAPNPNLNTLVPINPNTSSRQPYPPSFNAHSQYTQHPASSGYAPSNSGQSQGQDTSMASAYGLLSTGQGPGSAGTSHPISSNGPMITSEQYQSSTINSNQYPCFPPSVNANLTSSISLMMPQYPGAINSGQSQYGEGHLSSHSHQQQQHSATTTTSQSQQLHPSAGAINSDQWQPSSNQLSSLLQAFLHSQFR